MHLFVTIRAQCDQILFHIAAGLAFAIQHLAVQFTVSVIPIRSRWSLGIMRRIKLLFDAYRASNVLLVATNKPLH